MHYAMSHIPKICFIDNEHRSRIRSRPFSLHVSLDSDSDVSLSKPERTHFHYVRPLVLNAVLEGTTRLALLPSYNRAIVVEFESRELRALGCHQISSQKFGYGQSILKPNVEEFKDTANSRGTMYSFLRSKDDHPHSIHEALRRFFCLEGMVHSKVGIIQPVS